MKKNWMAWVLVLSCTPALLLVTFRKGRQHLRHMLLLGALYAAGFLGIMALSALVDGGRFAQVYMDGTPVTAQMAKTRQLLLGRPIAEIAGPDLDAAVLGDIAPIDDVRSTREYRAHCARILVKDFVRQLGAKV